MCLSSPQLFSTTSPDPFHSKLLHLWGRPANVIWWPHLESLQTYAKKHAGQKLPQTLYYQTDLSWWHTPHLDCMISSLLSLRYGKQHAAIGLGSCTNKPAITLAFSRAHTQTGGKELALSLLAWASWQCSLWMRCPVSLPSVPGKLKLYTRGCLAPALRTIAPRLHHYFINSSQKCFSESASGIISFVLF